MDGHKGLARGLVAVAAISAATAIVAPRYNRPGGLALLAELDHPVLLTTLAAVCLAAAALLTSRRRGVRTGVTVALAGAAAAGVLAIPVYLVATDPFPSAEYDVPAPDGSPRRLVVERDSPLTDPVWRIYVDAGHFPTTRRWPVAEYPDGPEQDYPRGVLRATWTEASHITLTDFDHAQHHVLIAPDGRARDTLGW
ncbi:hypothetical protein ACWDYJ_35150 [Streptomyces sp. NPDC003042]